LCINFKIRKRSIILSGLGFLFVALTAVRTVNSRAALSSSKTKTMLTRAQAKLINIVIVTATVTAKTRGKFGPPVRMEREAKYFWLAKKVSGGVATRSQKRKQYFEACFLVQTEPVVREWEAIRMAERVLTPCPCPEEQVGLLDYRGECHMTFTENLFLALPLKCVFAR
jgi:hypothetical protein